MTSLPGIANWHFWLAFIGTGVLLVVLAWAGGRRRRLSPRQIAAGGIPAACGSCGYDLTGLPGNTCPECGSDLELVGRLSPRFHRWASVPITARLIIWTGAIAAFGAGLTYIAIEYALPRLQQMRVIADWTVQVPNPGEPLPGSPHTYAQLRVRLDASFERRLWPRDGAFNVNDRVVPDPGARWSMATLDLDHHEPPEIIEWQGQRHYAHRKLPRTGLVYLEPDQNGRTRVSRASATLASPAVRIKLPTELDTHAAVLMALDQAAYDGGQARAEDLAADLAGQIDNFLRFGGAFPPQTGSVWESSNISQSVSRWRIGSVTFGGNATRVDPIAMILASGFWLGVWTAGLPFILRRRPLSIRRLQLEDDADPLKPLPRAPSAESAWRI